MAKTYEYLARKFSATTDEDNLEDLLDAYGKAGWRFVTIAAVGSETIAAVGFDVKMAIFERPLKKEEEQSF